MSNLIPQLLITLSPEGELVVETTGPGVRHQSILPLATAGTRLRRMLLDQQRRIEGSKPRKREARQPDWIVLAKHPQVEIRQMLPGHGVGTSNQTIKDKSLEELGL